MYPSCMGKSPALDFTIRLKCGQLHPIRGVSIVVRSMINWLEFPFTDKHMMGSLISVLDWTSGLTFDLKFSEIGGS